MGLTMSRIATFTSLFWSQRQYRILLVGLDNAGKTTMLYKLRYNDTLDTIPTIGFNTEEIEYKNVKFCMWDVGGQERIRALWRHYYHGSNAIIFMVDSCDTDRIADARDELRQMLADDELRDVCVLVLANKQDLPRAAKTSKVAEGMGLYDLPQRIKWHVQGTVAVSGEGVFEGLDWLAATVKQQPESN